MNDEMYVNTLSLMATKCAPDTFDLSSNLLHVNIRDQIVRAQLLIRDLKNSDRNFSSLLVVGAGIAGAAAAIAASDLGLNTVLVDVNKGPFALQKSVSSRYVGPFMYEWPMPIHNNQSYPPSWGHGLQTSPIWQEQHPIAANALAIHLETWLRDSLAKTRTLDFLTNVNASEVEEFIARFTQGYKNLKINGATQWNDQSSRAPVNFAPDYVILAAGMGAENTTLHYDKGVPIKGKKFWDNDTLRSTTAAGSKIAIFGGGDGALQDMLRVLTEFDHPLQFINSLKASSAVSTTMPLIETELASIEQQHRLMTNWTTGNEICREVDTRCKQIASDLAKKPGIWAEVIKHIRPGNGEVIHILRGDYFTRAYMLNRFVAHLVKECLNIKKAPPNLMQYQLIEMSSVVAASQDLTTKKHEFILKKGRVRRTFKNIDVVVVRYGIEDNSPPGQNMIQLSRFDTRQRTTLAQVALPYVAGP